MCGEGEAAREGRTPAVGLQGNSQQPHNCSLTTNRARTNRNNTHTHSHRA